MAVIDGINVAMYNCDSCQSSEFYIFGGQDGEGYKIACATCHKDQRELINEMGLRYLWKHRED